MDGENRSAGGKGAVLPVGNIGMLPIHNSDSPLPTLYFGTLMRLVAHYVVGLVTLAYLSLVANAQPAPFTGGSVEYPNPCSIV